MYTIWGPAVKILALSARLPYPLDTGAKIRSFHILKALAEQHELTLLSFIGSSQEEVHVEALKEHGITVIAVLNPHIDKGISMRAILKSVLSSIPITVSKYSCSTFRLACEQALAGSFDLIHCEHLHMAQYISTDLLHLKTFDAHNVESEIVQRLHDQETSPCRKLALAWHSNKTKRYEQVILKAFDLVMAVSDKDTHALSQMCGINTVQTVENGVDTNFFSPRGHTNSRELVFVGSMDWCPNDDGIRHFIENAFPLILSKDNKVHLSVVGRRPSRELLEIAKNHTNVTVTGTVDDVRPYIEKAAVYVVPLRVGGGTRLKVLEAFAMGKAVVSTSLGSEGIAYHHGKNIMIADDPVRFADTVLQLLDNAGLRSILGENAAALANSTYSWKIIGAKMLNYYDILSEHKKR